MSETFHEDTFRCGDEESLVAYLYDECEPLQRERITAHVATCVACALELEGLTGARRSLASWGPPDAALGFRVTSTSVTGLEPSSDGSAEYAIQPAAMAEPGDAGRVLRPARWWQRPLPAWGQAAAAALIFAAGMSVGSARQPQDSSEVPVSTLSAPALQTETSRPASLREAPAGGRTELARIESDLRAEIEAVAAVARQASAEAARLASAPRQTVDEDALVERVQALVQESERRQRGELVLVAEAVANLDAQRRFDMAGVQRTVEGLRGLTVTEVKQNRDALNQIINTWYPGQGGALRPVSGR